MSNSRPPLPWSPSFLNRSAAFRPLQPIAEPFTHCRSWPAIVDYNLAAERAELPLRFENETALTDDLGYEARVATQGIVATRAGSWHDFFNMLSWLAYPQIKRSVVTRQVRTRPKHAPHARGPTDNMLAHFEECGALVLSSSPPLLHELRAFHWRTLFWTRRAEVMSQLKVFVTGHGLLSKLLSPYPSITAHCLLIDVDTRFFELSPCEQRRTADTLGARAIQEPTLASPRDLQPLPLLGVPGWTPDNARASYYDDTSVFRPRPQAR